MGYYFIKPKLNTNLCLSVENSTMAAGQNVIVYTTTGNYNITQKWFVERLSSNQFILNASNQAYGLTMTLGGNTRNCVIQLPGLRESDSASVDIVSSSDGYHYIKMHTTNWYLCCDGSSTGSNVYWALNPGGIDAQKWRIESTTIPGPSKYTYMVAKCSTCELHMIRTDSGNLKLYNVLRKTLEGANVLGINGAFFNRGVPGDLRLLNVAKYNGQYVGPSPSPDGGERNDGCGNGVIYRTTSGSMYFVEGQNVLTDSSLSAVKNLTGTVSWAQGGGGMYLGYSGWKAKAQNKFPHSMSYSSAGRTALVVDTTTQYAYLTVTPDNVNYEQFRKAIMEYLGISDTSTASTRFLGLFLDGGSSSQLRAKTPSGSTVYIHTSGGANITCEDILLNNIS